MEKYVLINECTVKAVMSNIRTKKEVTFHISTTSSRTVVAFVDRTQCVLITVITARAKGTDEEFLPKLN